MNEEILKEGINTGVIIAPIRPTDFVSGGESGIAPTVLEENAQYDPYLPDEESQWKHLFDSFACVTFSATNNIEILLNRLIAKGLLPQKQLNFLKTEGYIDPQTSKVNFSDRFTAKMSGTTKNGNSLPAVGDSIRKLHGLLPEKDWMWPEEITDSMPLDDKWNLYYAEIPQNLIDKAKRFLNYFDIGYQWVALGTSTPAQLKASLPQGPFQIAASVCSPWNSNDGMPPIPACGCGSGHATVIYGYLETGAWKDFDHYKSFRKLLASDYCIPWGFQYVVAVKAETVPPKPFTYTFSKNLTYGAHADSEVRALQTALQTVKGKNGKIYMKQGVFGPYGPATKDALGRFQVEHGIVDSPPGEHFGPQTRAALNNILKK